MGFLSQIVNKFLPTKPHSTAADGWENPNGSGAGQLVVSESENWYARKARTGAVKTVYSNAQLVTGSGSPTQVLQVVPNPGNVAYVTHLFLSADTPGFFYFGVAIGNNIYYASRRIHTAGSFDVKLDGAFMANASTSFDIKFNPDFPNAKVWVSAIYMEVTE